MCVANFAAVPHDDYRLGLPSAGRVDEVLNTDADAYAGSGVGNLGVGQAADEGVARPARVGDPDACRRSARSGSPPVEPALALR